MYLVCFSSYFYCSDLTNNKAIYKKMSTSNKLSNCALFGKIQNMRTIKLHCSSYAKQVIRQSISLVQLILIVVASARRINKVVAFLSSNSHELKQSKDLVKDKLRYLRRANNSSMCWSPCHHLKRVVAVPAEMRRIF